MNRSIREIIVCFLIVLIPVLMNELLYFGPFFYFCTIPLIVALFSIKQSNAVSMLIAFGIGMALDILSDGVPGLNAGAAVFCTMPRRVIFGHLFNLHEKTSLPSLKEAGVVKHLQFLSALNLFYFTFYVVLDGSASHNIWLSLARIGICVVANSLL